MSLTNVSWPWRRKAVRKWGEVNERLLTQKEGQQKGNSINNVYALSTAKGDALTKANFFEGMTNDISQQPLYGSLNT